jgi:hypothetical protein
MLCIHMPASHNAWRLMLGFVSSSCVFATPDANCVVYTEQAVTNGDAVVAANSTVLFPRRSPGYGTTRPTVVMVCTLSRQAFVLLRSHTPTLALTEQFAERKHVRGGHLGDL